MKVKEDGARKTLENFISMLSRGILTLENCTNPLSMAVKPNFGPMSPTVIPINIRIVKFTDRRMSTCISLSLWQLIKN